MPPSNVADDQRRHWQETYRTHPRTYGELPSAAAVYAADLFRACGRHRPVGARRRARSRRHTGDPHYGAGTANGDDIFEHRGFAVHFFARDLVDDLATGWTLCEVHPFEEGELPRRLWRITQQKLTSVDSRTPRPAR